MARGEVRSLTLGEAVRAAKSAFWCGFLFRLVLERRAASILELGTNLGISAAYLATAQRLAGGGRLVSIEGAPSLAALAREHLRQLGLEGAAVAEGRFAHVLPEVLPGAAPLDFVFVDGHHDGPATIRYFEQMRPFLAPGAVVVFDDVAWSAGMAAAWREVSAREGFAASLDLGALGVCVVGERSGPPHPVRIPVRG